VVGRSGRVLALLATSLVSLAADAAEGTRPAPHPKRVLALFDFSKDSPANVIWDRTIRDTLTAGSEEVDYYAEFLDAARFAGPDMADAFHDYLERKYAKHPIDVIIAMDLTTRFLLERGRDLFVGVPIIHTVAVGSHPAADSADPRLIGIRGVFDAGRTLETALRFHPGTQEVVVVCGTATGAEFLATEVRRQLAPFDGRVQVTYLTGLSLDELRARVGQLDRHTLVLFVVFYDPRGVERPGRYPGDVAGEIARLSGRPVYGLFSSYLHDGVVGGHMYSLEDASTWAAKAALRILKGANPRDVPAVDAPVVPMFNWRELRRWGIDESQLPRGSRVLFRDASVWEEYGGYLIAGAAICLAELALIGALLLERRRRRRALFALESSHAELEQRIAERERAEQELHENHLRLEEEQHVGEVLREADRRKDEFLATLAHELRNPLAAIGTAMEIMRSVPPGDGRAAWARDMSTRQVGHLSRMIEDLLDVSRITQGKVELRQEPLDIGAIASQALDATRPALLKRGLRIVVELPSEPTFVRGDVVRLTQVIANLLDNAGKYTDSGGQVTLRVTREGPEVVIRVADDGMGIPPALLGRVFDLFVQGAGTRGRAGGGLGIGLTLVKRIVVLHGGSVHATSAGNGRGSEFVVRIPSFTPPAAREKTPGPVATPPLSDGEAPESRRILVVDDNVDAAEALKYALVFKRHDVDVVHDGMEAVRAAERWQPDVVLLDIDLPTLNGLEVARALRSRADGSRRGRMLLVAITGLGGEEFRQRTRDAGFDHHLVKPIDLSSLDTLLRQ
jgi:signal transduction histidine kinase/CheY-like chemotaxis protein